MSSVRSTETDFLNDFAKFKTPITELLSTSAKPLPFIPDGNIWIHSRK